MIADELLQLPLAEGGTRCRVHVYASPEGQPVVVLTELSDNPGLPVPAVVARVAAVVAETILTDVPGAPVWVEAWWGRALASVVNGAGPATTYMKVDLQASPPGRAPIGRRAIESMIGAPLPESF